MPFLSSKLCTFVYQLKFQSVLLLVRPIPRLSIPVAFSSTRLPAFPSQPSNRQTVNPSLSSKRLSIFYVLSVYLSICPPFNASIFLSVYPSIRLSVYPSIRLSIFPSIRPFHSPKTRNYSVVTCFSSKFFKTEQRKDGVLLFLPQIQYSGLGDFDLFYSL